MPAAACAGAALPYKLPWALRIRNNYRSGRSVAHRHGGVQRVYDEDGKDDIGVLKGVLPLMSRHATGYHPISYAVWYEYSKGTNTALKKDVEAELQFQERLTAAQTYAIYVKHLVDPAERAVLSARTGLLDLVEDVKDTVEDADKKTSGFDSQLTKFEKGLATAQNIADLKGPVSTMLVETRRTSEGLGRINQSLDHSRGEVQRLTEELRSVRQEAQTDSLSGLLNRRGFDLELERLLPKDGRASALALIMIDIDNFKVVNDTYGHSLGDAVIAAVGQFIRDCVGANGAAITASPSEWP